MVSCWIFLFHSSNAKEVNYVKNIYTTLVLLLVVLTSSAALASQEYTLTIDVNTIFSDDPRLTAPFLASGPAVDAGYI
jgi:hypothetical protein